MFVIVVGFILVFDLVSEVRCMVIILWKDMGRSRGMNNKMWRYGLTGNRAAATSGRFRGEALRCVSTRRFTLRTGVNMRTDYLEKRGSFVVKSQNRWPVFRCTVNWSRARLKTALIAGGAQRSSSVYAAGVWKCVVADVGCSVLHCPRAV